jgi:predicted Rossmann fold nucleotide-binding protein DprA/Smf involved in DNA uptake
VSSSCISIETQGEECLPPLLTLTELPGVGQRTAARVLRVARERGLRLDDILVLPSDRLADDFLLPETAIERLTSQRKRHAEHCHRLWRQLQAGGVALCEPRDARYPERWRVRSETPPPFAYVHGNPSVLAAPTLAVLTSRTIDAQTVAATVAVLRCATAGPYTVVSGGMKATHRVAAVAVKAAGAPRAIVLDRGLFRVFGVDLKSDPFGFGPGRAPLDLARTLVVSTFRPYDHAAPANGRHRDRLIADLADVVVAIHARPGGEIEQVCLRVLDRGGCVLSWQGENVGLVAAGAVPIDEGDLQGGFGHFV